MTDIVERLREYASDDHERGCQGRYYDCSCGYDDKRDPLMVEAATEIERLKAGMMQMADAMATQVATIERLRAALLAFADHFGPLEDNIMLHEDARRCFALARAALEGKQ